MLQFLRDFKSRRASKWHYLFKSYGDFAELVDFTYGWSFSGEGSASAALFSNVISYCSLPSLLLSTFLLILAPHLYCIVKSLAFAQETIIAVKKMITVAQAKTRRGRQR